MSPTRERGAWKNSKKREKLPAQRGEESSRKVKLLGAFQLPIFVSPGVQELPVFVILFITFYLFILSHFSPDFYCSRFPLPRCVYNNNIIIYICVQAARVLMRRATAHEQPFSGRTLDLAIVPADGPADILGHISLAVPNPSSAGENWQKRSKYIERNRRGKSPQRFSIFFILQKPRWNMWWLRTRGARASPPRLLPPPSCGYSRVRGSPSTA